MRTPSIKHLIVKTLLLPFVLAGVPTLPAYADLSNADGAAEIYACAADATAEHGALEDAIRASNSAAAESSEQKAASDAEEEGPQRSNPTPVEEDVLHEAWMPRIAPLRLSVLAVPTALFLTSIPQPPIQRPPRAI